MSTRAYIYEGETPVAVERLGIALEPHEPYEVGPGGGGVEDPHVVYVPLLKRFVMTYTAFVPYEPRVAIAVSEDLYAWRRLGLLRYEVTSGAPDLNRCGNTDLRADGLLDVYYCAADRVIAVARLTVPSQIPPTGAASVIATLLSDQPQPRGRCSSRNSPLP